MGKQNTTAAPAGAAAGQNETPEQLLDVFKAAALSVTTLYRTAVSAETKARAAGYQDCLDDLLTFLERDCSNMDDAARAQITMWAAERREGRDAVFPTTDSEDEVDKPEARASPEPTQPVGEEQASKSTNADSMATSSPPPPTVQEVPQFVVPSQDEFTFQSSHQYPNIATLDLSDTRSHSVTSIPSPRTAKARLGVGTSRSGSRHSGLGRGAGMKRRMDLNELFGGCFGGKDPFGGSNKRGRHT